MRTGIHSHLRAAGATIVLAATICGASPAQAQSLAQAVVLHYNLRPPYMVVKDGVLTGVTGTPAVAAFKAAAVPFILAETPATRQLETLKANQGMDCMAGWFKNTERERFAKFTKPIYRTQPSAVLTAADNSRLDAAATVEALLERKDLMLLVKQSYSYGRELDALIEKHQPKRSVTADENTLMFRRIQMQMADYMFVAPEEVASVIAAAGFRGDQFKLITPGDMPKGELRYIMCSKNVPDEVISRLNAAIK